MSKKTFFKGAFILSSAGFISRFLGFFYRIFLSHTLGASGLGIFQLTVPLQSLLLAISTGGMQTAISHICASKIAQKNISSANDSFLLGTIFSTGISLLLSIFLYTHAAFIACVLLQESLTEPLLLIFAFSLPLSTLHTCINSYSFARQKTVLPSALQLIEQCTRMLSSYILYLFVLSKKMTFTPVMAGISTFISELSVAVIGLIALKIYFSKENFAFLPFKNTHGNFHELLTFSFPLTLNRILLTLLGSIEVLLIPKRLMLSGLPNTQALATYGVLSGMTLPLLFFPSTFTNSVSVMLVPSITKFHTLGNKKRIRYVVQCTYKYMFTMGAFFTLLFLFFGNFIGNLLFHNPTVGIYLHTLSFVCPFLYLNVTLSSILNGLKKHSICLFYNLVSLCLRIFFVIYMIPKFGINGYLYGILLSEILKTLLYSFSLIIDNR